MHTRLRPEITLESAQASLLKHNHERKTYSRELATQYLITPLMQKWEAMWLRQPETWQCRTRSHDNGRRQEDLLMHLFERYPVPDFLRAIWFDLDPACWSRISKEMKVSNEMKAAPSQWSKTPVEKRIWSGFRANPEAETFIPWYVAVANGMSLHKECAHRNLSRREVHIFLHAPDGNTPSENIWWARARNLGANLGMANNLAHSKLARFGLAHGADDFWGTVGRFFVQQDTCLSSHDIDDLLDYLVSERRARPDFRMKGRTLKSVQAASETWHRLEAKRKRYGSEVWGGHPYIDYRPDTQGLLTEHWTVHQITTGKELVEEGHAQHHCVSSYRDRCIQGDVSIWSVRRVNGLGESRRRLTLEVDRYGQVVQARGFSNSVPGPGDLDALKPWLDANGILLSPRLWRHW